MNKVLENLNENFESIYTMVKNPEQYELEDEQLAELSWDLELAKHELDLYYKDYGND